MYFEEAFEAVLPPHRQANWWAKSHHLDNSNFEGKTLQDCFKLIDRCDTNVAIADLMNEPDRYFAWNFRNLFYGGKATIKWRQPPAVTTATGCLVWLELAINFVQSARRGIATMELAQGVYGRGAAGLYSFALKGVAIGEGLSDHRYLDNIFKGKPERVPLRRAAAVDADLLKAKVKEDQKKGIMKKKLDAMLKDEKLAAKKATRVATTNQKRALAQAGASVMVVKLVPK